MADNKIIQNSKIKMQNDNSKFKIIFWGTPEFAAIILDSLIENNYKPVAVITSPDKPVGRKQILTPPPVKILAQEHNIPVVQPESLKTYKLTNLQTYRPDLFIVAAYGLILPREFLDLPKHGSLNVHPSLLPKYRGASPIQATILNGDQETGVTIILMDEKVDHGNIIVNSKFEIRNPKITTKELSEELAKLAAKLLLETLPKWINGEIKPIPQDHLRATFTKIIKKTDGYINWDKPAEYIERQIRAYNPWPSTYTYLKSKIINHKSEIPKENKFHAGQINSKSQIHKSQIQKTIKIIKANILKIEHDKKPGTIFSKDKKLIVACGKDALILEEIQLEGKRKMTAQEFLNGYPEIIGSILD